MMQVTNNNMAAMSMYQRYDTATNRRGDGFTEMLHSSSDNPSRPEEDLSAVAAAKKKAVDNAQYDAMFAPSDQFKSLTDIAATHELENSPVALASLANALFSQGHIDAKTRNMLQDSADSSTTYATDIVKLWEDRVGMLKTSKAPETEIRRASNLLRILKNINALAPDNELALA